jgi:hypothetical protein
MIRVYRSARISPFWLLLALPLVLFVGLPILLAAAAIFGVLNLLFALLRGPSPSASPKIDPNLSGVIQNEEIGPYRVKQNPHDPSVIEVVDERR